MLKKRVILLCACFGFGTAVVAGLYAMSERINSRKNAFIRQFPPHALSHRHLRDLHYNSYYIAGLTAGKIFLGNFIIHNYLITLDYALKDTQHINIGVLANDTPGVHPIKYYVDSPDVYITDESRSAIWHTRLDQPQSTEYLHSPLRFDQFTPLSATTFVIRHYDTTFQVNRIVRQNINTIIAPLQSDFLTRQADGFFSTDGIIRYNNMLNRLIYVYYYRNQYINADSNLHIIFTGHTIDTVSTAKLKIALVASEHRYKIASPPFVVNKYAATSGKWLFVCSSLLADNEERNNFDNNSVIDMYSIPDRRYFYSFYLPNVTAKKITDLKVNGSHVIAINDHFLSSYQLNY